jgi:ubiquinone/menaquinone biosynthesis C-methylase UbiE/uncharacterized protein YbaR (Trm112 family)
MQTYQFPKTSALLDRLCSPKDHQPLQLSDGQMVSENGKRFDIKDGILRTLVEIDPMLARELEAQSAAIGEYTDPKSLMCLYEKDFVARLAIDDLLNGYLETRKPEFVLDAGCGIGMLGRLYPEMGFIGLDASMDLLGHAGEGYRLLVEGSAECMPFRSESFDMVVALNMLHHVINPEKAVAEFARVLKPGGVMIVVDPRKVALVELGKSLIRSNDPSFAPTHKAFGVEEYRSLISSSGRFRIEEERRVGLVGLIGMASFDALGISQLLPSSERAVDRFIRLDETLFRIPGMENAGLNLAMRAIRT